MADGAEGSVEEDYEEETSEDEEEDEGSFHSQVRMQVVIRMQTHYTSMQLTAIISVLIT